MTPADPLSDITIKSKRNRWIGALILTVGLLFLLVALSSTSQIYVVIASGLIVLESLYLGLRMIGTSSIKIESGTLQYRTRRLESRRIPLVAIRKADLGSRVMIYERRFPQIELTSGETINLTQFEEAGAQVNQGVGLVANIISTINDAL